MKETELVLVYCKVYIRLHSPCNKVVSLITYRKEVRKTPQDIRGKHKNVGNAIQLIALSNTHDHVSSSPTHIVHCTSTSVTYLYAETSEITMNITCLLKNTLM